MAFRNCCAFQVLQEKSAVVAKKLLVKRLFHLQTVSCGGVCDMIAILVSCINHAMDLYDKMLPQQRFQAFDFTYMPQRPNYTTRYCFYTRKTTSQHRNESFRTRPRTNPHPRRDRQNRVYLRTLEALQQRSPS